MYSINDIDAFPSVNKLGAKDESSFQYVSLRSPSKDLRLNR